VVAGVYARSTMSNFRDRNWEKHEMRGHQWGDAVPPEKSAYPAYQHPPSEKPRRRLVRRARPMKKKGEEKMTPDDAFKQCMEACRDEQTFIATVSKWLDEPRFDDKEVENKSMMVDKTDWHGARRARPVARNRVAP